MNNTKSNKANFVLSMMSVVIPMLMQLVFIRYVSYEMDKNTYADFVMLQTLIAALSYIFLQIPNQSFSRFFNESDNRPIFINEFRSLLIIVNMITMLSLLLFSCVNNRYNNLELVFLFFVFVLMNNFTFNQNIFLYELKRRTFLFLKIIEGLAKCLGPIIGYLVGRDLISTLTGLVAGYTFSFITMLFFLKEYPFKLYFNKENTIKYIKYSYPVIFVSIFTWGISFSDRIFIDYYLENKELAIYAVLTQVSAIGQLVGQAFMMYVNPIVLKEFERNKLSANSYLSRMLKKLLIIFISSAIFTISLPRAFFTLLIEPNVINDDYYFYTFFFLVIGIFFTVYQTAVSLYFNLYKKLHIMSYIYFVAFCANIAGNFFIKEFGILAAAISTCVSYFIITVLQRIALFKLLRKA